MTALTHQTDNATDSYRDLDGIVSQLSDIRRDFAGQLPELRILLDTDVSAAFRGDPAARSVDEVLICYSSLLAIIHHRLAHRLHLLGAPLVARIISEVAHGKTGIDIHPGAQIGESFFIDHGTGVVIGETATRNCGIFHGRPIWLDLLDCEWLCVNIQKPISYVGTLPGE